MSRLTQSRQEQLLENLLEWRDQEQAFWDMPAGQIKLFADDGKGPYPAISIQELIDLILALAAPSAVSAVDEKLRGVGCEFALTVKDLDEMRGTDWLEDFTSDTELVKTAREALALMQGAPAGDGEPASEREAQTFEDTMTKVKEWYRKPRPWPADIILHSDDGDVPVSTNNVILLAMQGYEAHKAELEATSTPAPSLTAEQEAMLEVGQATWNAASEVGGGWCFSVYGRFNDLPGGVQKALAAYKALGDEATCRPAATPSDAETAPVVVDDERRAEFLKYAKTQGCYIRGSGQVVTYYTPNGRALRNFDIKQLAAWVEHAPAPAEAALREGDRDAEYREALLKLAENTIAEFEPLASGKYSILEVLPESDIIDCVRECLALRPEPEIPLTPAEAAASIGTVPECAAKKNIDHLLDLLMNSPDLVERDGRLVPKGEE